MFTRNSKGEICLEEVDSDEYQNMSEKSHQSQQLAGEISYDEWKLQELKYI